MASSMQHFFMSYLNWLSYNPFIGLVIMIAVFWIVIKILGSIVFGSTLRAARVAESKEIWNDR